jgi:hypothetical protein
MDINRPVSNVPELDLNRLPSVNEFPSFIDIRMVCRKKVDCRDVLIRKYGEERYNAMLLMPEPVILSSLLNFKIIIFVLYN